MRLISIGGMMGERMEGCGGRGERGTEGRWDSEGREERMRKRRGMEGR